MVNLISLRCSPANGQVVLDEAEVTDMQSQLDSQWEIVDGKKLRQSFIFDDFMQAMLFINDIAALAEDEGHHPDLHVSRINVLVELTTDSIDGLSTNDFILARKIEMCC